MILTLVLVASLWEKANNVRCYYNFESGFKVHCVYLPLRCPPRWRCIDDPNCICRDRQ